MAFSPTLDILVHLYYWSFFSFQSVQCHSFTPLSMINTIQGNWCNSRNNNHAKSVIVWNHLFASLRTKEGNCCFKMGRRPHSFISHEFWESQASTEISILQRPSSTKCQLVNRCISVLFFPHKCFEAEYFWGSLSFDDNILVWQT